VGRQGIYPDKLLTRAKGALYLSRIAAAVNEVGVMTFINYEKSHKNPWTVAL
jgi:hypothetical protein